MGAAQRSLQHRAGVHGRWGTKLGLRPDHVKILEALWARGAMRMERLDAFKGSTLFPLPAAALLSHPSTKVS